MCCSKWSILGLTAAGFGAGVLLACLLPLSILVPLSAVLLVVAGVALIL